MDRASTKMTGQNRTKTVSIHTLGCRSNQYDSSAIEDMITAGGYVSLAFPAFADAYIINTCTVTNRTDAQSRQVIRKAKRLNPKAVVLVTGCYAQVSSTEVAGIEGVDFVLGNPDKDQVLRCLDSALANAPTQVGKETRTIVGPYMDGTPFSFRATDIKRRTRVNLKVQDGCERRCSYCIIPKARGRSRSLSLERIIVEIRALIKKGFKEFVFTGIHLGGWGHDLDPKLSLIDLLTEVEAQGFPARFRISSIDPDEVTDEFTTLLRDSKTICNHLHLPIQSGSDKILRLMKRPYNAKEFTQKIETLIGEVPGLSIGTDIIAGFPGEGDIEFEETRSLVSSLPLSYFHIFPYSARKATLATSLPQQVRATVIKERCAVLRVIDTQKRESFYKRFIGSKQSVLIEGGRDRSTGLLRGRTTNYIPVFIRNGAKITAPGHTGVFADVQLGDLFGSALYGDI